MHEYIGWPILLVQSLACVCVCRYRSFGNEHRTKPLAGFIDGDLVEKYLDLPYPEMEKIAKGVMVSSYCRNILCLIHYR